MADYNSSLPIRTQNPGDAVVKIADSITPSQQAQVTSARELSVLSSAQPGVDIGDVTINNASGGSAVNIQDGGNSITVDGSVTVSATDLDIRDLSSASDSVTAMQGTDPWNENLAQIAGATPSATNALPSRLTDGSAYYDARDIRSLSSATDSVTAVISGSSGDPVNQFQDEPGVASGGSSDNTYTVTAGKTLHLNQIEASASGKMKIELKVETGVATDSYDSYAVMFNSSSDPNISLKLSNPILVAAGVRVFLSLTNRDVATNDLFSTISGYEV